MPTSLIQIALLLINSIGSIYLILCVLRVILPFTTVNFHNPLCLVVYQATKFSVNPLQKIIPSFKQLSTAALLWAYLVQLVIISLLFFIKEGIFNINPCLWQTAFVMLANQFLNVYFYLLIISVIASFIGPYSQHPGLLFVHAIIEPILRPLRQRIPSTGVLDFSPLILFLLIQSLSIILRNISCVA